MRTIIGAAEPPEPERYAITFSGPVSMTWERCPVTEVDVRIGCRCMSCRPDIYPTAVAAWTCSAPAVVAGPIQPATFGPPGTWLRINA